MAAQAGQRRPRALCPEPGHRQWVAPPEDLSCSLCDETYSREAEHEVSGLFLRFSVSTDEHSRQPVTIRCGHTFCRGCATRWFDASAKLCPTGRCPASKGVKCVAGCSLRASAPSAFTSDDTRAGPLLSAPTS